MMTTPKRGWTIGRSLIASRCVQVGAKKIYVSNLTLCSPFPRSIFTNRFATQAYNARVCGTPVAPALPVMISFSRFIGNVHDGWAMSSPRSSCAVCICCTVGSSRGVGIVEKDERELSVGESGVGALDANVRKRELQHFSASMTEIT
jgi:hypothetical protein